MKREWARILVRANLRIFATAMLADRPTYENRDSVYSLAWTNLQTSAYETGPGGRHCSLQGANYLQITPLTYLRHRHQ